MFSSRNPFSRILYNLDPGHPPAGNPQPSPQPQPNPTPQPVNVEAEIQKAVDRILNSKRVDGDKDEALRVAVTDAHTQRTRAETAERNQLSEADKATLQAAQSTLQELGVKDFAELKTRIKTGDDAITEAATLKKTGTMREACEKAGIDYADLSTRKGVDDWEFDASGEAPTVTFKDDKGNSQTKPLAEHATAAFPTLAKAGATKGSSQSTSSKGGAFVKQGVAAGAPNVFDRAREKAKEQQERQAPAATDKSDLKRAGIT